MVKNSQPGTVVGLSQPVPGSEFFVNHQAQAQTHMLPMFGSCWIRPDDRRGHARTYGGSVTAANLGVFRCVALWIYMTENSLPGTVVCLLWQVPGLEPCESDRACCVTTMAACTRHDTHHSRIAVHFHYPLDAPLDAHPVGFEPPTSRLLGGCSTS